MKGKTDLICFLSLSQSLVPVPSARTWLLHVCCLGPFQVHAAMAANQAYKSYPKSSVTEQSTCADYGSREAVRIRPT